MRKFEGKTAVVTGGASGIGRGLAGRFGRAGMNVVVADIEEDALKRTVAELEGEGHRAIGVVTNTMRRDSIAALADRAQTEFGNVHILCNNAGVASRGDTGQVWEIPDSDWEWVMGVNFWGRPLRPAGVRPAHAGPRRGGPHRQHGVAGGPHPGRRRVRRQQARSPGPDRGAPPRPEEARCADWRLGPVPGVRQHPALRRRAQPAAGARVRTTRPVRGRAGGGRPRCWRRASSRTTSRRSSSRPSRTTIATSSRTRHGTRSCAAASSMCSRAERRSQWTSRT